MGARTATAAGARVRLGSLGCRRRLGGAGVLRRLSDQPRPETADSVASVAIVAPLIEEAAKGLFLLILMTGRRRNELNSLTDCLVYAGVIAAGFAWLEDIGYIATAHSIGRVAGHRRVAADHGTVRPPVVHHDDRHRGLFRAAAAKRHREDRLYPARLHRRGDHARVVERLVAARPEGLPSGLRAMDGADLRAGDRTGRRQPAQGAARRCLPSCPAWWPPAW